MRMEIIGLAAVAILLLLVIIGFVIRAIMQRQYEKALIDYQNKICLRRWMKCGASI